MPYSTPTHRPGHPSVIAWEQVVRVLSVPANHRYVAHLGDPSGQGEVFWLPDRQVGGAGLRPRRASPALRTCWLHAHHQEFDVVHLHFGFESISAAGMRDWLATIRQLQIPLVFTVHDLQNPHTADQLSHRQHLDLLIPAADHLITATPGAAAEISDTWPDHAPIRVIPHPHMAPLHQIEVSAAGTEKTEAPDVIDAPERVFMVGLHLQDLRANSRPWTLVRALAAACERFPAVQLTVHVNNEVLQPGFSRSDPELIGELERLDALGALALHVVDRMSDHEVRAYLRNLDVSVLPHAWGTHSGWLEECRDLGATVLAPDLGFLAQQASVLTYRAFETDNAGERIYAPDADSLASALEEAIDDPPSPTFRGERIVQRRTIAQAHEEVYRSAVRASESRERRPDPGMGAG